MQVTVVSEKLRILKDVFEHSFVIDIRLFEVAIHHAEYFDDIRRGVTTFDQEKAVCISQQPKMRS